MSVLPVKIIRQKPPETNGRPETETFSNQNNRVNSAVSYQGISRTQAANQHKRSRPVFTNTSPISECKKRKIATALEKTNVFTRSDPEEKQQPFSFIGRIFFFDGSTYEGELKKENLSQGIPHGYGVLISNQGDTYMGEFKHGHKDGYGILSNPNGAKYEGEFKEDLFHGQGKIRWADGNRYAGQFVQGLRHGRGLFIYSNKNVYYGQFVRGNPDGLGRLRYADGSVYTGQFQNGEPHGPGKLVSMNGQLLFKGEFKHGAPYKRLCAGKGKTSPPAA